MHMDVAAMVMTIRVGAYQRLMSGEMLFTELLAQRLRPIYGQAVIRRVTGAKLMMKWWLFTSSRFWFLPYFRLERIHAMAKSSSPQFREEMR